MLRELPELVWQTNGAPPHLLVVGLGKLGKALLWRAARDWRIDHKQPGGTLRITVVDDQAETRKRQLDARYLSLTSMPDVEFAALDNPHGHGCEHAMHRIR